jgi:hypothetical protein
MGIVEVMITKVFFVPTLNVQKSMFKITMKSNAKASLGSLHIINLLTKM